jgi:uncharacterized protein (DUF1330 family)
MAAYFIAQIKITREEAWPEYRKQIAALMERFGGKYIVRGGAVEVLEGDHDGRRLAIAEFPSMDAIRAFWASPDYVPIKKLREGAGLVDVWAVPGV